MRLKLTLGALSLAVALSLTGCGNSDDTPSFIQVKELTCFSPIFYV